MKTTKLAGLTALALSLSTLGVLGSAGSASALCYAPPKYSFASVSSTILPTSTASKWLETPGDITYSKTTTSSVSGSVTATVSAEAGIVFAKASVSLGVTVGAEQSWSDTFSYTKHADESKGNWARLHLYREARKFTVTKKTADTNCVFSVKYVSTVTVPVINGDDYWKMDYKN